MGINGLTPGNIRYEAGPRSNWRVISLVTGSHNKAKSVPLNKNSPIARKFIELYDSLIAQEFKKLEKKSLVA